MVVIRSRYKGAQGKKVAISKPRRKTPDFDSYLGSELSRGDLSLFFKRDSPCVRPMKPQWYTNIEGPFGYSPIRLDIQNYLLEGRIRFFMFVPPGPHLSPT